MFLSLAISRIIPIDESLFLPYENRTEQFNFTPKKNEKPVGCLCLVHDDNLLCPYMCVKSENSSIS